MQKIKQKMTLFEGEIELQSVYMSDYVKKTVPKRNNLKTVDDNCLIIGLGRNALKLKEERPIRNPDVFCPLDQEFYKKAVSRFAKDYPCLTKRYMQNDIDPTPVEHEKQDLNRTEYLTKYCPRDLPCKCFLCLPPSSSVYYQRNLRALQTLRLPDVSEVAETTQRRSYRPPNADKYKTHPSSELMRPVYDPSLQKELRRILRVKTGETSYGVSHGLLAQIVLDEHPFGPPREEPRYGKWQTPNYYTYTI